MRSVHVVHGCKLVVSLRLSAFDHYHSYGKLCALPTIFFPGNVNVSYNMKILVQVVEKNPVSISKVAFFEVMATDYKGRPAIWL